MRHIIIITIIILVFLVSYFLSISLEIKEQVTVTLPNGTKYVGEWKDGEQNGQGTYSFSNGMKYIGKFRNANYNGEGILTLPDGRKVIGEFREDKPWNVSLFDKKGNFKMKWVNGKKQ